MVRRDFNDTNVIPKYEILEDRDDAFWIHEAEDRLPYSTPLRRIRALRDFGDVKKGDIGGYVEGYHNLSHDGNCWVYKYAKSWSNARVEGDAQLRGRAEAFGSALVKDQSILDTARVGGDALISGSTHIGRDHSLYILRESYHNGVERPAGAPIPVPYDPVAFLRSIVRRLTA